jgi:hypothetical protein
MIPTLSNTRTGNYPRLNRKARKADCSTPWKRSPFVHPALRASAMLLTLGLNPANIEDMQKNLDLVFLFILALISFIMLVSSCFAPRVSDGGGKWMVSPPGSIAT